MTYARGHQDLHSWLVSSSHCNKDQARVSPAGRDEYLNFLFMTSVHPSVELHPAKRYSVEIDCTFKEQIRDNTVLHWVGCLPTHVCLRQFPSLPDRSCRRLAPWRCHLPGPGRCTTSFMVKSCLRRCRPLCLSDWQPGRPLQVRAGHRHPADAQLCPGKCLRRRQRRARRARVVAAAFHH